MSNLTIVQAKDDWGLVASEIKAIKISCKIGQPTSLKGDLGKFNFSNPEWPSQEKLTDVVIVNPAKTRVLYGKKFTDPRRCGSDNFATPSPFIVNPVSANCLECPLSRWDSDLSDEQKEFKHKFQVDMGKEPGPKPLCAESIDLVVVDGRMIPFTLHFQKTQIKLVTQNLINRIMYKGKRPYQVMFDISLKKPEGKAYFDCVYENFRDVPESGIAAYEEMFMFLKAHGQRLMSEQFAAMDQEREIKNEDEIPF